MCTFVERVIIGQISKGKVDKSIGIVGEFNTDFPVIHVSNGWTIKAVKNIEA